MGRKPLQKQVSDLTNGFVGDPVYRDLRELAVRAAPETRLASERDLAKRYGISHTTIRRVLGQLASEGLIRKVHGKGSFTQAQTAPPGRGTVLYASLWADQSHTFFVRRLQGIAEQTAKAGLRLEIFEFNRGNPESLCLELRRPDVVGLLLPWLTQIHCSNIRAMAPHLPMVGFVPGGHTGTGMATSSPDFRAAGRLAAEWLCGQGCRNILGLDDRSGFAGGMQDAATGDKCRGTEITIVNIEPADRGNYAALAATVLGTKADGLAFADDRAAGAVAERFQAAGRPLPRLASVSNAGENILPPEAALLVFDGMEVGRLSIHLLQLLLENPALGRIEMLVQPELLPPNLRSPRIG